MECLLNVNRLKCLGHHHHTAMLRLKTIATGKQQGKHQMYQRIVSRILFAEVSEGCNRERED